MKICQLDKEKTKFREKLLWTVPDFENHNIMYSKLTFTSNKDIIFHGWILRKNINKFKLSNFRKFYNCFSDFIKILKNTVCIEQDGTSKMYQLFLNKTILMKAGEVYTVQLIRPKNWAEHFITYGIDTKNNCEGVKFKLMLVGSLNIFFFLSTICTKTN